jgi:N-methylhydantoinase A
VIDPAHKVRIGIDVGGTFTDVVAVDAATRKLVGLVKVPTSHTHADGVAAGIVIGLERLMREHDIAPERIAFIAHSTTQATNALLEGDLSRVGIIGFSPGSPLVAWWPERAMRFAPIELGGDRRFTPTWFRLRDGSDASIDDALARARAAGCVAIAASEAFGVDRTQHESRAVERARAGGFAATSGHEVATIYGLRARTRTAALNAAILPRMLHAARTTARAVLDAGIAAPLMIMRSDGGVMDVGEVERRPILTMLSGPAAGIAGALLHENVTDGIFIEVGGTSADCSAIKNGQPQMRPATIGGQRTLLRTLDVRTLAIAGGSLIAVDSHAVRDVGPRSAHIAGLQYATFTSLAIVQAARYAPVDVDGTRYAALVSGDLRIGLTPTCAANMLGHVPGDAFAKGDAAAARAAFAIAGAALGIEAEALATDVLDRATEKLRVAIVTLIADYGLDPHTLAIVGGGGGAAALVPYAAKKLAFASRLARDAEVISPLGVALALVRDVVERSIVDPTPDDLVRIRRQAIEAAIAAGAAPDRIEVVVDVDRARNRVRATASGATALVEGVASTVRATDAERIDAAVRTLRVPPGDVAIRARAGDFVVVGTSGSSARSAIVDERGVVRAITRNGSVRATTVAHIERDLTGAIDDDTVYGDVGRALPETYVIYNTRIADVGGTAERDGALALVREELAGLDHTTPVVILTARRRA